MKTHLCRLAVFSLAIAVGLIGCTGPKPPPGWPSGEERPINPSQITKAVK